MGWVKFSKGSQIEQDFYKTFFLYQLLHEYRFRD
jgi:hypothetical protein